MRTLKVIKNSGTISKVTCSCGYITFVDNSDDADYLAYIHSLKHSKVRLEVYVDGVFEDPNRKRAKPGRPKGNQATQ